MCSGSIGIGWRESSNDSMWPLQSWWCWLRSGSGGGSGARTEQHLGSNHLQRVKGQSVRLYCAEVSRVIRGDGAIIRGSARNYIGCVRAAIRTRRNI
jgi:hypothetical protein